MTLDPSQSKGTPHCCGVYVQGVLPGSHTEDWNKTPLCLPWWEQGVVVVRKRLFKYTQTVCSPQQRPASMGAGPLRASANTGKGADLTSVPSSLSDLPKVAKKP